MRLKGALQDEGVRLLDRGMERHAMAKRSALIGGFNVQDDHGLVCMQAELLPLLEKFGKTCMVLFRPGDVHFIQKPVDADGMQVTARCTKVSLHRLCYLMPSTGRRPCQDRQHCKLQGLQAVCAGLQELFFEEGSYLLQARYKDFIAFGFDLSLLRRASSASTATMATLNASAAFPSASPARVTCTCCRLQVLSAATRNDVDTVEMKLTLRNVPSGGDAPDQSRPFLSFSTADHRSSVSIVQDLPITKPFAPSRESTIRHCSRDSVPCGIACCRC